MGDIEPHSPVLGAAPFGDLRIGGQRHPVAGRELHALWVVAFHEPLPQTVAQDSALSAGRLGDEGAGGVLGFDDARGMELDEFGIAQSRTSLDGQAEGVAGVLIPA